TFHDYPPLKWGGTFKDFNIKCSFIKNDHLYLGVYTGWLYDFDIKTKQYARRFDNGDGAIYSIIENTQGDFLLGTYSQDGLKILKNNALESYFLPSNSGKPFSVSQISCVLQDEDNSLFIGTRANGLFHYHNGQVDKYGIGEKKYAIKGNKITVLFKDNTGRVWVGTADGGLSVINKKKSTISTLTVNDGLKDNKICGIVQDKNMRIWMATRTGISEIDPSISVIKTYDYSSGIQVFEFSQNSILRASDNTIYVGGDNGFISFNPDELTSNSFIPPIIIDNILINNKPVAFEQSNSIDLNLSYNEANIAIEYSALNYIYPKRNKYAYKLDGVDKDWNYVDNVRKVNYANLQPGEYVFHVIGSNNDDVWNEVGTSVHIRIAPPFWLSVWAYILYFIIAVLVIYGIIHYFKVKNNLNSQMLLKQEQEAFHLARTNLFTNFSHELRTPLSLIISPLEDVMEKGGIPNAIKESLSLIHQNAGKMLQLVNELMDFRKKESGLMTIKVAAGNFGKFTEEIVIAFNELAKSKEIDLIFNNQIEDLDVWYDRFHFEKIFFNLLSNAFKHTSQHDSIEVNLRIATPEEIRELLSDKKHSNLYANAPNYLKIEIEDTGMGINHSEFDKIFAPFYQSIDNKRASLNSSGIGLSLTKGIVEMHHGTIWASNRKNGGAIFHIVIPLGKEHFDASEIIEDYHDSENIKRYTISSQQEIEKEDYKIPAELQKKFTILIVEDNKELRHYIRQHINKYYKVLEAVNGKEGLIAAINHMPDLIISDIMMPEMDGLEMTHQLKEDTRTSHIPIILLTARTSVIQMKEGLEFGADDYITKPFNSSVLLLKIKNIILSRENLKNLYGKGFALENMGVEIITSEDRFMQRLCGVVEKNISEPNLNIERFCTEIGMSRANLYRKIKTATNLSPLEYVKTIRLQVASKMLKETDLSVTEISERVGFNSLINFSASFKKHYGLSPTKYAATNKQENTKTQQPDE
ncbi:MAG: response regulator, partial [Dysgonomonas sp.]